jgi:integrase
VSYRVLVTIGAKQRKKQFLAQEDALACQSGWEIERISAGAAIRPKITRLTNEQLTHAEAALEFLKPTGLNLIEAAQFVFRNYKGPSGKKSLADAIVGFLQSKEGTVGERQMENYQQVTAHFLRHVGSVHLGEISGKRIEEWLQKMQPMAPKTWNYYRDTISGLFTYCCEKSRLWLHENPVDSVKRLKVPRGLPERLDVSRCVELMRFVEKNYPDWVVFFSLALFAGIRPDLRTGELADLARVCRKEGVSRYFRETTIYISEEVAKEGIARQVPIAANLADWLSAQVVTPDLICPGTAKAWEYRTIRRKLGLSHDVLRHTSISAHVAKNRSLADAAIVFGNSETVIRRHYLNSMSSIEADQFYEIRPSKRS